MARGLPGEPGADGTPDTEWQLTPKWRELKRRAKHFDAVVKALEVQCVKAKWAWQFLAAVASDGHNREHAGRAVALVECPESPCPGWRADLQSYRDAIEDSEAALIKARKL